MKQLSIFILFFLFQITFGQERIITGKVLDEGLLPFPGVQISYNSEVVATSDLDGKFELKLPSNIKEIVINFVGVEGETVKIYDDCNYYGIILLNEHTYCFVTSNKAKRLAKRHRNKLPKLYKEAYKKELFGENKSCR